MESSSPEAKCSTILKTPDQSQNTTYQFRQNQITTVVLHGVPIVALNIDSKERLCLAQISNTLLKQFSYNEIHNRRVALGITCVQCTPVQLEILRRAGAMPISSRRCGMITKREAERLVKSFLEDNRPPKLPDNFYFEVIHNCGWGCKGKFEPSRYNSSRAKCIRCNFCNLYFSPNKFIFHFHRAPDAKYNHPDAANFNSWRRHLHLSQGSENEDIHHAWEDVKAMFNGGSRKKVLSPSGFTESQSSSPEAKRPKLSSDEELISKQTFNRNPYNSYPLFSMPGKNYPLNALNSHSNIAFQYQMNKTDLGLDNKQSQNLAFSPWRQPTDYIIPPYDLFWTSHFNARQGGLQSFGKSYFNPSPVKDLSTSGTSRHSPTDTQSSSEDEDTIQQSFSPKTDNFKSNTRNDRISAFRPVGKMSRKQDVDNTCDDIDDDINDDVESTNEIEVDDLDVGIDGECSYKDCNDVSGGEDLSENRLYSPDTSGSNNNETTVNEPLENTEQTDVEEKKTEDIEEDHSEKISNEKIPTDLEDIDKKVADNEEKTTKSSTEDIQTLTKEELQRQLTNERGIRKQVEGDINKIKKSLQEQVSKEKSQRDEITKQLEAMKDALCNELEQERKIRFTMQQKLKEAHDALHTFSCKMFSNKPCSDCVLKETVRQ
ncbi:negative regulation of BMP signaling pathway [Mactra antiquata]